jgi:hypothetical protein
MFERKKVTKLVEHGVLSMKDEHHLLLENERDLEKLRQKNTKLAGELAREATFRERLPGEEPTKADERSQVVRLPSTKPKSFRTKKEGGRSKVHPGGFDALEGGEGDGSGRHLDGYGEGGPGSIVSGMGYDEDDEGSDDEGSEISRMETGFDEALEDIGDDEEAGMQAYHTKKEKEKEELEKKKQGEEKAAVLIQAGYRRRLGWVRALSRKKSIAAIGDGALHEYQSFSERNGFQSGGLKDRDINLT